MISKTWFSSSLQDTSRIAREITSFLKPPQIVALQGGLGAGKTTLVKFLCHYLQGIPLDEIQSPTFSYVHEYSGFPSIYHFDCYRLKNPTQFDALGLADYLNEPAFSFCEWAERVPQLRKHCDYIINIQRDGDGRLITFTSC